MLVVKYVNQPKPGKKLGNLKMETGEMIFFDPAKFAFTVGVGYDLGLGTFGDGARIVQKVLKSHGPQGVVVPPAPGEPIAPTGSGDNIAPWWMPYCSNLCAHAIQAGLIKTPNDLNQWALKAGQVAVAVKAEVGT